jgi:WD40 repeat protein
VLLLTMLAPGAADGQAAPRTDAWGDPLPPGAIFRSGSPRTHPGVGGPLYFSPDGRRFAAAARDLTIRVWDAQTGQRLRTLPQHERPLGPLAFSTDGKTLAVAAGQTVHLWDLGSGREVGGLHRQAYRVVQMALAPDGKWLATAGGRDIDCWDAATGRQTRRLRAEGGDGFVSVALSPDGKLLAAECYRGPPRFWDTATGRELRRFKAPGGVPLFLPDGKALLTATADAMTLWEVSTGKQLRRLEGATFPCALSPDGKLLAAGDGRFTIREGGVIHLWDTATGRRAGSLQGGAARVSWLAFAPTGRALVTFGPDRTLRRWDTATGKELSRPPGHQGPVTSVAFSADGKLLASTSADGTARVWAPRTGREVHRFQVGQGATCGAAFLRGNLLLTRHHPAAPSEAWGPEADGALTRVRLWDLGTGQEYRRFDAHKVYPGPAAFSADNRVLALSSAQAVRLLDSESGRVLRSVPVGLRSVVGMALSPDGRLLAVASDHSGIRDTYRLSLWDVAAGKERWREEHTLETFTCAAFSPGGDLLATGGTHVRLWEAATGKELGELAHARGCLAFSPDGKILATLSWGDAILLWEVATGRLRRRFAGHGISCLAFSPDGRLLASGGHDTLVMAWDVLRPGDLADKAPEFLWGLLADEDAAQAFGALCGLASRPGPTVAFLKRHLPVVAEADHRRLRRLIADLDADEFAVRQRAVEQLEALGAGAETDLRWRLAEGASAEVRRRAEVLLGKLHQRADTKDRQEQLRGLRLVEVLEHIGTAEAEGLLKALAERGKSVGSRREARAALDRLAGRTVPSK